jgi:hypothetical protein
MRGLNQSIAVRCSGLLNVSPGLILLAYSIRFILSVICDLHHYIQKPGGYLLALTRFGIPIQYCAGCADVPAWIESEGLVSCIRPSF